MGREARERCWPLRGQRPAGRSPEGEGIHDKPCALCFKAETTNHFACSAWPELDTADQPMEPRSGPILQLIRGPGLQVLDGSQCESRARNLELSSMGTRPGNCCRVNWQWVSLSGQRVVLQGLLAMGRCTCAAKPSR